MAPSTPTVFTMPPLRLATAVAWGNWPDEVVTPVQGFQPAATGASRTLTLVVTKAQCVVQEGLNVAILHPK
jgi:hypothetical protein